MLVERLKTKFNNTEPIFASEIRELFSEYTEAYVYRLIKQAESKGEIIKFSQGVYYMPEKTFFGVSTITADDVIAKRYVVNGKDTFGIYSGLKLLNAFSATTQVPNTIEVVTNNETTRKRVIVLDGRKFILRRSRTEITKDNVDAYTVLQFFSDIDNGEVLSEQAKTRLQDFITKCNVDRKVILSLARSFPARTMKNLVYSGVLDFLE